MAFSQRRVALVTGASHGIGREIAKLLAGDGHELVLVGRDEEALRRLSLELGALDRTPAPKVISLDLARPGAMNDLHAKLGDRAGSIEVLVNNAGAGTFGPFVETPENRTFDMLRLNVEALTVLTRLVLPSMVARRSGRILNVASTAAFQPGPFMAVYYASKAYVLSLSEALHEELRGTGVTVTCLCPGPTRTEFHARAGMSSSRLMNRLPFMKADAVARAGYAAMQRGKPLVVPGFTNRMAAWATRIAPRALLPRIVRRLQQ